MYNEARGLVNKTVRRYGIRHSTWPQCCRVGDRRNSTIRAIDPERAEASGSARCAAPETYETLGHPQPGYLQSVRRS